MLQGTQLSQSIEPEKVVISEYLEKFGAIAGRVVTEQMYSIYFEALEGVDLRRIEKGLKRYLQEGKRWPWPGELREFCEEEI